MRSKNCPRCRLSIQAERLVINPVICNSCGHVVSRTQQVSEDRLERSQLLTLVLLAVFFSVSFVHVMTWGSSSLQIVVFEAKEIFGQNSTLATEDMAQACLSLNRFDCTEKLYIQLARTDLRAQVRLGKLQMNQRKFKEAAETFRRFFVAGGGDIEANYLYAKALGEVGAVEEAAKHFDYVLEAKPEVLQVTVMQNYVRFLIRANRLDQAKRVIQKIRRRDQTVSQFMENELKEIDQRMTGSGTTAG